MSIPDPVTTGIALAATLQAAKQAQDYISSAAGRPGQSIGTIVGDLARRRLDNMESVGNKAHLTLLNIGLTAAEVPLHILQPALEAASVQEDYYLQETWANLLANAADPRKMNAVHEAFPPILKELGPREVKYLNHLYEYMLNETAHSRTFSQRQLLQLYVAAGLSQYPSLQAITHGALDQHRELINQEMTRWEITVGVLIKLGLVQMAQKNRPVTIDPTRVPRGQRSSMSINLNVDSEEIFFITGLATAFIKACRTPPAARE